MTQWAKAAFVLDLSYWAHKAWHAVPATVRATTGEPVNMVQGVASMLVRLLSDRDPAWLVAAADSAGPTWRHALYPAYKAERVPHTADFDRQLGEVGQLLELHGVPVIGAPGFEGDDVIATLVRRLTACGIAVVVITADKDLRQVVTDDEPFVKLWDGKDRVIEPQAIRAEWGIEPGAVGDFLALVGDEHDGVPGVSGVGPVTAANVLKRAGSLAEVIRKSAWWRPEKVGRAIRENAEQIHLARRLVALRDDVPMQLDLGACAVGGYDAAGLRRFYERAGLGQLAERLVDPPAKAAVSASLAETWASLA
jgi:DNA polymerase-1